MNRDFDHDHSFPSRFLNVYLIIIIIMHYILSFIILTIVMNEGFCWLIYYLQGPKAPALEKCSQFIIKSAVQIDLPFSTEIKNNVTSC